MLILYGLFLAVLSIYSYSLIDLNLTLINHPVWNKFRDWIIQLGYFHRDASWNIYLALVIIGFIFYFIFILNYKRYNPLLIGLLVGLILLFAYPFLSHDLFNYLFDAKILTYYHQNPYLHKGLDFPQDPWIRFMHWTDRNYPYGPSFLPLTIVPSFLSFGKFILSFLFYKIMVVAGYFLTVVLLNKSNRKWALVFATHPLILIEGLVNGHNDLIAVSLAITGAYFIFKNKKITSKIFLLLSAGIKYTTFPLLGLTKNKKLNKIFLLAQIAILTYMGVRMEIQPWYYLTIFAFIPFYFDIVSDLNIFLGGLILSYYPYIRLGGWDTAEKVAIKHQIITVFFIANIVYITAKYLWKKNLLGFRVR
jgi:hypothetical protein